MSTPAILAESFSSFSKSTLKSLKDLEKQLTQAATDTRDAQNERDNVIKQSHASQLQLDTQARDILKYKSSLMQAELTVESQADIIAQLQREVNHWKEQARNWQDHFTRVEEERCSLSTKLDEIMSSQSQSLTSQFLSTHLITGIETPLSTKRNSGYFSAASKHSNDKSKSTIQSPATGIESPAPAHKSKPAAAKTTNATKARKSEIQSKTTPNNKSPPDPPVSRLLRRVQAIVTVKSEEDDEEEFESPSISGDNERDPTFQPTETKQVATGRRKSRRVILEDDEESQFLKDLPASDDDDEDELILSGKDAHPVAPAATFQPNTPPPSKKRKLNNSARQKPSKKS
ncbi:hypothetical protein F5887DRAFT_1070689 [Amanita rubescens]|nr:hypothetical protein F5887DRAFT_1070689 [Amanita rubescens]